MSFSPSFAISIKPCEHEWFFSLTYICFPFSLRQGVYILALPKFELLGVWIIVVTVLICTTVWLLSRSKRVRTTMRQQIKVSSCMMAFLISLLGGWATRNSKIRRSSLRYMSWGPPCPGCWRGSPWHKISMVSLGRKLKCIICLPYSSIKISNNIRTQILWHRHSHLCFANTWAQRY